MTTSCASAAGCIDALERAERALVERDVDLADRVRWDDAETNELQRRINAEITTMIATQQPMARDVRILLGLHHASAELERMGDYAVNISKLAQQMASEPETPDLPADPAHGAGLPRAAAGGDAGAGRHLARRRPARSARATTRSTACTARSTRPRSR